MEGKITYTEALEVLKTMKNDKFPGSDGFTAEFHNFLWKDKMISRASAGTNT